MQYPFPRLIFPEISVFFSIKSGRYLKLLGKLGIVGGTFKFPESGTIKLKSLT